MARKKPKKKSSPMPMRSGGMPMDDREMAACMKKMSHAQCLKRMKKRGM